MLDHLKIAIVCDWLTVFAGAERVIYQMHKLFPKAHIYTSLYDPKKCHVFKDATVIESNLKWIPGAKHMHRVLFPLMPKAFESFDLDDYDIVISSSHSAAKGIITRPETLHISYCHSPMRYVWDHCHEYQRSFKKFTPLRWTYLPILHKIRIWDRLASERVDHFIANSKYISGRIQKYYGRESEVITPPVDLESFKASTEKGDYFLAVGRLIPYKRFDLLVEAANKLKFRLNIVGTGPEMKRLKRMAGDTVEFLGQISQEQLAEQYQHAKALLFPQLEDFGIVPLEAMASGTPVIAYGKGGALETVEAGKSGLFFEEQSLDSIVKTIKKFKKQKWDYDWIAQSVDRFAPGRFRSQLLHSVQDAWKEHRKMLS